MDRKKVLLDEAQTLRQREFERKIAEIHRSRGKTPLAMVPGVLLGFVESLMVMMVLSNVAAGPANPVIAALTPPGGLLAIAGFFLYGCVMTAIMVVVSGMGADAVAGKGWNPHRGAPQGVPQHSEAR